MQAGVVIPVDPFQGFPFDLTNRLPGAEELDDLGLEQADDAFGQSIVIGISDAADRGRAIPLTRSKEFAAIFPLCCFSFFFLKLFDDIRWLSYM